MPDGHKPVNAAGMDEGGGDRGWDARSADDEVWEDAQVMAASRGRAGWPRDAAQQATEGAFGVSSDIEAFLQSLKTKLSTHRGFVEEYSRYFEKMVTNFRG